MKYNSRAAGFQLWMNNMSLALTNLEEPSMNTSEPPAGSALPGWCAGRSVKPLGGTAEASPQTPSNLITKSAASIHDGLEVEVLIGLAEGRVEGPALRSRRPP